MCIAQYAMWQTDWTKTALQRQNNNGVNCTGVHSLGTARDMSVCMTPVILLLVTFTLFACHGSHCHDLQWPLMTILRVAFRPGGCNLQLGVPSTTLNVWHFKIMPSTPPGCRWSCLLVYCRWSHLLLYHCTRLQVHWQMNPNICPAYNVVSSSLCLQLVMVLHVLWSLQSVCPPPHSALPLYKGHGPPSLMLPPTDRSNASGQFFLTVTSFKWNSCGT